LRRSRTFKASARAAEGRTATSSRSACRSMSVTTSSGNRRSDRPRDRGEHLLGGLDLRALGYECTRSVAGERATHVHLHKRATREVSVSTGNSGDVGLVDGVDGVVGGHQVLVVADFDRARPHLNRALAGLTQLGFGRYELTHVRGQRPWCRTRRWTQEASPHRGR
jgi:hypothetical protein